jgi:hypothetical protein
VIGRFINTHKRVTVVKSLSRGTAIAWNHRAQQFADGGIRDTFGTVVYERRKSWRCNPGGATELGR